MLKRAVLVPFVSALLVAQIAGSGQGVTTYWQDGACAVIDLGGQASLDWCVETVTVTGSGRLELAVTWRASGLSGTIDKGADTGNEKMYLVDNLGTRYDHIETRGAAANGGLLKGDHETLRGVFVFPPPKIGASQFSFRDDDQHIVISGITSSEDARSDRALSASVLGRVMQTEGIQIDYSWSGLRGRFQEGYVLGPTDGGFRAEAVHDDGMLVNPGGALIPMVEIESFLAALAEAPILTREYVPRVTHTDDYPSITIELRLSRDTIVIFSESQGVGHVPWAVESKGQVFVIPDDTPARALLRLDPFLGRDLASRAREFLVPHVGDERALEIWAELEEQLGAEDAYKTAFRLKELLGGETDDDVLATLETYLDSKRAPATPEPAPSALLANGDSALVGAARVGEVATIERLLERGMNPDERSELDGYTAIIAASLANRADVVGLLLASGADPSVRSRSGETALTLASAANHVEVVEVLLGRGLDSDGAVDGDVNVKGRDGKTPLMRAAENGHAEMVVVLLEAGAQVDMKSLPGDTALGLAAENRHLAVVRLLLGADADANSEDRYGETPLMKTLHPGIASALIRAGADVNAVDEQGSTAAMGLSAGDGSRSPDGGGPRRGGGVDRVATLQALLSAGADVDARDQQGRTALIWAATGATGIDSHPEMLPVLIAAGANVDAKDSKGGTALLYASINGHLETARILVDAGADVNVRMGRTTALGFALQHEHAELVTLLLRSGARR